MRKYLVFLMLVTLGIVGCGVNPTPEVAVPVDSTVVSDTVTVIVPDSTLAK